MFIVARNFFIIITFCSLCLQSIYAVPRVVYNDEFSDQLLSDLQYLLSSEETMDFNDSRLQNILNKYDYNIFKAYKAFIEFQQSQKNEEDHNKVRKAFYEIYKKK